MQIYTEPGTICTILVQVKDLRKNYKIEDVMDDLMKALDHFPILPTGGTQGKKGVFAMTFYEDHMGRIKEVVWKIRKNTSLQFKYVTPPGMEDAEVEVTLNESEEENENTQTTITKQGPAFCHILNHTRGKDRGGKKTGG